MCVMGGGGGGGGERERERDYILLPTGTVRDVWLLLRVELVSSKK